MRQRNNAVRDSLTDPGLQAEFRNINSLQEARTAMGTRTARYGTGAAVMALLALGIVVAANAISVRHNTRWDLTENKRNSVSPQTLNAP